MIDRLDIEDVYELSPLQQGLLFHSLLDPASGFYVEQYTCLLEGDLDLDALELAWQQVVDAHAALRGSFHWRDLEKPLQVVRRRVAVQLDRQDWRGAPAHEAAQALDALMAAERARGFDLAVAPVMRWSVLRLGENRHQLVWSFHHLLIDGWSLQLVLGEVFARYDALRRKVRFAAPAPRPYGDYIGWLQGQDPRAAEAFWRQSLAGFRWPTRLGLCVNAVAEPATAEVMDAEVWRVPADATAAVLARAREWKVTPNALVLAAWTLLLARYADEREVVVGAVSSGRPPELSGVESMVGAFANTLPLRVPVDPDARVLPWLGEVQARQLQALEYQWSSLVEIQGWSEVPRGTPLFESLFVFQNAPGTAAPRTFGGVALRDVRFNERTHLPLTLEAWLGDGLTLTLFYDRRRFACDSVRNALQQLATVIEAIPRDPDARLRDLPLLDAEARRRVLVEWNATGPGRWDGPFFPEAFAAQVARTPEATAVNDGRLALSYRDLDRRSSDLARRVREAGVGGGPVAVCLPRSTNLVIAFIALLKAGCAYLPLDPRYPATRLRHLVEDSGAGLVVTDAGLCVSFASVGVPTLEIDGEAGRAGGAGWAGKAGGAGRAGWAGWAGSEGEQAITPEHLAYVIYTSGSTGRPKGVMLTHGGCANHLHDKVAVLGLTAADVVAQTAPQGFDVSIWQMLAPLVVGARVEVFADEVAFDPTRLLDAVESRGVTVLQLVPSLLRAALEYAGRSAAPAAPLQRLRWMVMTGEALPPDLCRAWFAYRPHVPMVNAYGPTECSDDVTHHVLRDAPAPEELRVPIGRVVSNLRLYVLDGAMRLVAPGLIGELFVGGAGVGNGYLGKPGLTAASFVPDPFGGRPGARLYRTGDQVRQRPDGSLDFLARLDHQVKIRGYRIEPGEIQAVLAEQPGVRDCAVIARSADRQGGRLVAYVVVDPDTAPAASGLRDALRRVLPDYMVPSSFMFLDTLPLTSNGKLDRAALPEPAAARPDVNSSYAPPTTQVEQGVAAIWEELLGLEHLGVHDNFFELGGHSLLAMRLLSRVNERFAVDLMLRQVFDHPTVAGLATAVVEAQLDAMPEEELAMLLDGLEMPMLDGELLGPLSLQSMAPAIGEVA
jgi:amino acid adenylation domain-containing protein